MPETASLEAHEASPPPATRRDVRVVTPAQLAELRREQQEIYQSLRQNGSGPSDAAREIGIPRSLANEWERSGVGADASEPAMATDVPATAPVSAASDPGPAVAPRIVRLDEDARDLARQAQACAKRIEREMATLRRLLKRMEAAIPAGPASGTSGTPPAPAGTPERAARSSLTAVLLARGRARQHPPPSPRA